jgi:hypothetical protein
VRRWKLKTFLVVGLSAVAAFLAYRYWPARAYVDVPYADAVREATALYPILDLKTEDAHRVSIHGDTDAIRRDYPAYDYHHLLWNLDVRHRELIPGRKFEVTIVNRSKFEKRETTITVESAGTGVRVTAQSWEDGWLPIRSRDREYEQARLREIRDRLGR